MKQKWLIILLIGTFLTGCSSESQEQAQQSAQYSKTIEDAEATEAASPFDGYKKIEVDGGDMSGYRQANVVVDIGFGDREYWAYTNEYGQLVRVTAEEIIPQDDSTEPAKSSGRYYNNQADVEGTKLAEMEKVIRDAGGCTDFEAITTYPDTTTQIPSHYHYTYTLKGM